MCPWLCTIICRKTWKAIIKKPAAQGGTVRPPKCILLYSGQDVVTNRFLIEHGADENEALSEEDRPPRSQAGRRAPEKNDLLLFCKRVSARLYPAVFRPNLRRAAAITAAIAWERDSRDKSLRSTGRIFFQRKKQEELTNRPELYEELRTLRKRLAARAGVPAYVVFTDRALREMAGLLPTTEQELLEVSGVGRAKCERYGFDFFAGLAKIC